MEKLEYKGTSKRKAAANISGKGKKKNNTSEKKNTKTNKNTNASKSTNNKSKSNSLTNAKLPKKKVGKKAKSKLKIVIIVLCVLIVIAGIILIFTLPSFNAIDFEIEGTEKYTKEEIIQKSGLKINKNIFWQLIKGVSKNINELPYIESATVKVIFPNKLDIKVKERTSYFFAFDKDKDKFYKVDRYGYILAEEVIENKSKEELLAYGFIFDDEVVFGSCLKEVDISKIQIYEKIQKAFEKSGINGSITKVNFENSLTTLTLNDKLNVIFPNDTDIKYKMSFLKSILAKIGEDSVGVIDMTKDNPVFSGF